ncbi:MAG: ImmA/IrrE family metallo-endopeptidase [Oscillospiraceae bacterium]|nr:ImmA/IrrE family metallo-endopeptidase [Oscillospiraceae bacterium]
MIDRMELSDKAMLLRAKYGEDAVSPVDIFAMVGSNDSITVAFYAMGNNISGMCQKSELINIIAINSSMTLGRQRFSMAHELYHLEYDDNMKSICGVRIGVGSEIERSADIFASYFIMPSVAVQKVRQGGTVSVEDVIRLEQIYGMSHQAMLIRLKEEKVISDSQYKEWQSKPVIRIAKSLGYDTKLYQPSPESERYRTLGRYIAQANLALERGLISDGKYEELMIDAHRPDLIYGDDGGYIND